MPRVENFQVMYAFELSSITDFIRTIPRETFKTTIHYLKLSSNIPYRNISYRNISYLKTYRNILTYSY